MIVSYPDQCLERAEKAKLRADDYGQVMKTDVTELARRLKRACDFLRDYVSGACPDGIRTEFTTLADELEAPLGEK